MRTDRLPEGSGPLSFSERLNLLFRAFLTPPDEQGRRRQWSDSEIARAARELGEPLTRQYVSQLRSAERDNPSLEVATVIARAFEHLARTAQRPPQASAIVAYLAGTDHIAQERIHQQLSTAIDLRDSVVSGVAARLGTLDARGLRDVVALIDRLQAEQAAESGAPAPRRPRRRRAAG